MPAPAAEPVPEPDGYRMERFRAPVPATLEGGTVVATEGVQALIADGPIVLIDVLPRPPRPKNLKPGTVWRPRPRHNIPGSVWLPNSGLGALPPAIEAYFQGNIKRLTADDKDRKLLFYCKADCWMSWNAAKRAISYGYSQVYWYPDGTDGWTAAGLPTANAEPVPLPIPGS